MLKKLMRALSGERSWSNDQWRSHLLSNAMTESERQEIHAVFNRAE